MQADEEAKERQSKKGIKRTERQKNRNTSFSELCTHVKRAYKYTLQAVDIHFIIKSINKSGSVGGTVHAKNIRNPSNK